MRGSIQKLTLAGQEISLYLPPKALRNTPCRLLLAADGELLFEILTQLANTLEARMAEENRGLILVGLHSENRDADYTPWPAPGFDADLSRFSRQGRRISSVDRPGAAAGAPGGVAHLRTARRCGNPRVFPGRAAGLLCALCVPQLRLCHESVRLQLVRRADPLLPGT